MGWKRDKGMFLLFVLSCVFQVSYFYQQDRRNSPFAYMLGVYQEPNEQGILYIEILAVCVPLFFLVLYFKDYYTFYLENYGRLCLIRNCSRLRLIGNLFMRMIREVFWFIIIQWGIWTVWRYDYMVQHIEEIIVGTVFYFMILLFVLSIELFLCTCVKEEVMQIGLNFYILCCICINWTFENPWIQLLFSPGKIIKGRTAVQGIIQRNIPERLCLIILICGVLLMFNGVRMRFGRKDIF